MDTFRQSMIEYLKKLEGKSIWVVLGIFILFLMIEINFNHFDLSNDDWKILTQDQINKLKEKLNQEELLEDKYQDTKYRLMLSEYEYNQVKDIQSYKDNQDLIRYHEVVIPLLLLYLAVSMKRQKDLTNYSTKKLFSILGSQYLTIIILAIILLVVEFLFSLIIAHVFIGFKGFYHPVAVIINNHVVEMSAWKYLLITRGLALVQLSAFGALGLLISNMFNKWVAVLSTIVMIPAVLFALSILRTWTDGNIDLFVFFSYQLYDFIFWEYYSMPIEESTLGFALLIHGIYLILFLAGAWFFTYKRMINTNEI